MSDRPVYQWRRLTEKERAELLAWRKLNRRPWHSPPHPPDFQESIVHLTAACYQHQPYIGHSAARMDVFCENLLDLFSKHLVKVFAWCVLPNHYHVLVQTDDLRRLTHELGSLHGRSSHAWNGEEDARGRKVFYRSSDRAMRSDSHFWATINYVHHNPVRHGYVQRWTEWPWSSAGEYLEQIGVVEAGRIWKAYPLLDYGQGWDEPDL